MSAARLGDRVGLGRGHTVLVVEDDPAMSRVLTASLRAAGYRVIVAATGKRALTVIRLEDPAAVLLDLGLPDLDGIAACQQIRESSMAPIIVVTADHAEDRKVLALDEGVDDYVTKPFSMPELLARLRVALRRSAAGGSIDRGVLEVGDLRLDMSTHSATQGSSPLNLTPKQFGVLAVLARNKGKVVPHRTVLGQVWGPLATDHPEYLRVIVNQLRHKLRDGAGAPRLINEGGVGYCLEDGD